MEELSLHDRLLAAVEAELVEARANGNDPLAADGDEQTAFDNRVLERAGFAYRFPAEMPLYVRRDAWRFRAEHLLSNCLEEVLGRVSVSHTVQ